MNIRNALFLETRKKASPREEKSSQNQVLVYARFNEQDTIFQLYSKQSDSDLDFGKISVGYSL